MPVDPTLIYVAFLALHAALTNACSAALGILEDDSVEEAKVGVTILLQSEINKRREGSSAEGAHSAQQIELQLPVRQATCRHVKNAIWTSRYFAPLHFELFNLVAEEGGDARVSMKDDDVVVSGQQLVLDDVVYAGAFIPVSVNRSDSSASIVLDVGVSEKLVDRYTASWSTQVCSRSGTPNVRFNKPICRCGSLPSGSSSCKRCVQPSPNGPR